MKQLQDFIDATQAGRQFISEKNFGSAVNLAHLNVLTEADALCTECVKGTSMLCDGSRICFNVASKLTPEFELEQCWKLSDMLSKENWRNRMKQANLGDAKVRDILDNPTFRSTAYVSKEDGVFYVDGVPMESLSYGEYSRDFTNQIKEYVVGFVEHGFSPKYVFTVQLYKSERLSSTHVYLNEDKLLDAMAQEIYDPEWLILDGLDTQGNPKIRKALLKCLRWRLDEMRPTTVSLSKTVEAITDEEDDIYGEITQWNTFNLK